VFSVEKAVGAILIQADDGIDSQELLVCIILENGAIVIEDSEGKEAPRHIESPFDRC
jgi:hypothetical protein